MSHNTDKARFLEELIKAHVPNIEGGQRIQAQALEAVGLLAMQAERENRRVRESREFSDALKGPKAQQALANLQSAFRQSTGMNVFDTNAESLVRAAWNAARAVVLDERDKVSDSYENSGVMDTPDLDMVSELALMTEIPEALHHFLWSR